jgi:NAD(P)-dependent dehydrogenase (short-subunit alcohol dehydrogenase family)
MNVLLTGAASGLGAAIKTALQAAEFNVFSFDMADGHDVRDPQGTYGDCPINMQVLINCAGVNKTNWLENVSDAEWDDVMDVNAKGIFKMTQWALPVLKRNLGTVVNIVSNAAHIPMTCCAAYNASKGAAHILTLQLARELTRKYGITVFGVAPNKMAGTGISNAVDAATATQRGWTMEQVHAHQLAGLLPGVETPPQAVADFIAFLLSSRERHRYLSGVVLPYGA